MTVKTDYLSVNERMKHMNDNWKFDGTIWDFIETIQWALVIREASKRNDPDIGIIMTTPNLIFRKADEYGITREAIISEMLTIGATARNLLKGSSD